MRTRNLPGGGNTKGRKRDGGGPQNQNQQRGRRKAGSRGSQGGPKGSHPDKHGGSGVGRQEGGSGAGRER
jgi:hypothetical protein